MIIGDKFGRLTVLSHPIKHEKRIYFDCVCECDKKLRVRSDHLRHGRTRSCGCILKTHGMSRDSIYIRWQSMIRRCYNPETDGYDNYGGRGIRVCQSWLKSSSSFIDWALSNGFDELLQLDRKDNDKNYSPENCRFVKPKVNTANRYVTRIWHIRGVEFDSMNDAADYFQVSSTSISRWCHGYTKNGKTYPPKDNCHTRFKNHAEWGKARNMEVVDV